MTVSPTYMSFLIRLWHERGQALPAPPTEWHSEIECIQTGQRWTFTTLEEVLEFLRRQAKQVDEGGSAAGE
ncbi:MAG: hypothetical protein BroJett011_54160 [Chloroflexota bacterium]|nr:MAG: hypothetical protein BroJett011_54160 [Chloroflexota bacterium]